MFAPRLPPGRASGAPSRLADLFLDTLPYNAHTTASDALWAGLPVLTCPGETFAGRVAASLLHAVGLARAGDGVARGVRGARPAPGADPPALAALRARLAANRLTAPLFDTERFTRHLEAAYWRMWEMRLAGDEARGFEVAAID